MLWLLRFYLDRCYFFYMFIIMGGEVVLEFIILNLFYVLTTSFTSYDCGIQTVETPFNKTA